MICASNKGHRKCREKRHVPHAELDALKQNPNAIVKVVRTKWKMHLRLEVTQLTHQKLCQMLCNIPYDKLTTLRSTVDVSAERLTTHFAHRP